MAKVVENTAKAVVNVITKTSEFALGIAFGLVSSAVKKLIDIPDVSDQAQADQALAITSTPTPRMIVGEAVVSGPIIKYEKVTHSDKKEYHHLFVTLANHPCESVEAYQLDGKELSSLTGTGYYIEPRLGDQTGPPARALTYMTSVDNTFIGTGLTDVYSEFVIDTDIFANGLQDFKLKVKGLAVYDPRKDSTVGGAGTHRENDSLTWEWTDNAALIIYHWRRHMSSLDVSADNFLMSNIAAEASICDELVPYIDANGVTHYHKRYTLNGTINLTISHETVEDSLLTSCGGVWIESGGLYLLQVAAYRGPAVMTIAEADLAGAVSESPTVSLSDRVNKVTATYVSKDDYYQSTQITPIVSTFLRDGRDKGVTYTDPLQFPYTNHDPMAQRLANIHLLRNAAGNRLNLSLRNIALRATAGAVINIVLPKYLINGEYEIHKSNYNHANRTYDIECVETSADIYNQLQTPAERDVTPNVNIDNTYVAPVSDITYTVTPNDSFRQGIITWSHSVPNSVRRYNLLITKSPADDWFLSSKPNSTEYDVKNLPQGSYIVAISAENRFEKSSLATQYSFAVGLPNTPTTTLSVNVLPGRVHIVGPELPHSAATYQWRYLFTNDFATSIQLANGNAVTVTETPQDGTLYLWYRITEVDLVDPNWVPIVIPNLIGLDSSVVTPELIAGLTLPGLPQSMLDTISGITADITGVNALAGALQDDYDAVAATVIGVDGEQSAYRLDILRIDGLIGTESVSAQITNFANVGIGYEDEYGAWVEGALFARAFDEVKLINADEEEISVYSFFQALETATGELQGRINFAIDVNGRLTGFFAEGSETASNVTIVGDNFEVVSTSDSSQLLGLDNDGLLILKGGLGANTIRTQTAFTPELWELIAGVPDTGGGDTGGTVNDASLPYTLSTSSTTTRTLTIDPANGNNVTIGFEIRDSGFVLEADNPSNEFPEWDITIKRGGTTVHYVHVVGSSNSTFKPTDGFNISVNASGSIVDSSHGTTEGDPLAYSIEITKAYGPAVAPKLTAFSISQPINYNVVSQLSRKTIDSIETTALVRVADIGSHGTHIGRYNHKLDAAAQRMMIIDYLETHNPEAVTTFANGTKVLDYMQLIPDLYTAFYEVNARLDALEAE
jgi:hypothetical protein